jgi:hypothetical protein
LCCNRGWRVEGVAMATALDKLADTIGADAPASCELTNRQGQAFGLRAGHESSDRVKESILPARISLLHQTWS